jgi:hypothetical protein
MGPTRLNQFIFIVFLQKPIIETYENKLFILSYRENGLIFHFSTLGLKGVRPSERKVAIAHSEKLSITEKAGI